MVGRKWSAKLLPVSTQGREEMSQILEDRVTIFFIAGTSEEWVAAKMKELGIANYDKVTPTQTESNVYGLAQKYYINLDGVIGTLYQDQLEALWKLPQVKVMLQDLTRNPYLGPVMD